MGLSLSNASLVMSRATSHDLYSDHFFKMKASLLGCPDFVGFCSLAVTLLELDIKGQIRVVFSSD